MDYNTDRNKLVLPEYGRNIQRMVEMIIDVENRDERNKMANAIIQIMGNMNPHLRDINDFKHKLWDHLAIMADFRLDIDFPYELPARETFSTKPRRVDYNTNEIRFKHYGKIIEHLIDKASEMDECEERDVLVNVIANHMKKSYLTWNKDAVTDDKIFNDLKLLSKGKIVIGDELKLNETKEILSKAKRKKVPIIRHQHHKKDSYK